MRIIEKMQKHSKVEEAAIKLVRDLEMQMKALHNSYMVSRNNFLKIMKESSIFIYLNWRLSRYKLVMS